MIAMTSMRKRRGTLDFRAFGSTEKPRPCFDAIFFTTKRSEYTLSVMNSNLKQDNRELQGTARAVCFAARAVALMMPA